MSSLRTPLKQAEFDLKQALRLLRKAIDCYTADGFYQSDDEISPKEAALLVVRNMLVEVNNEINKELSEVSHA